MATSKKVYEQRLVKWLEALRSRKFKQCQGQLRDDDVVGDDSGKVGYCCLGVAAEVSKLNFDGSAGYLNTEVANYFGLKSKGGHFYNEDGQEVELGEEKHDSLSEMNDSGNYTFAKIARIIERNKEKLFTWAK